MTSSGSVDQRRFVPFFGHRLRRFSQIDRKASEVLVTRSDKAATKVMEKSDPETNAIIGAAMEVHRQLGHGFLEAVYQQALALEFKQRGIPYGAEPPLAVSYKGQRLDASYRADFTCYDSLILELKAVAALGPAHEAQLTHHLKAAGITKGLLFNFGLPSLECRRYVFSH